MGASARGCEESSLLYDFAEKRKRRVYYNRVTVVTFMFPRAARDSHAGTRATASTTAMTMHAGARLALRSPTYQLVRSMSLPRLDLRRDKSCLCLVRSLTKQAHQPAEWISLLRKAEQRDIECMYRVGITYLRGENGAPEDPTVGKAWLTEAAEMGHAKAQCRC